MLSSTDAGHTPNTSTSSTFASNSGSASYPTGMTQILITQPDSFYVDSVVIEDVDCFGNNSGTILISASGGNSLSYSIDGGLTIADSAFFDSLYAGTYMVQVIDSAGCQGTNSSNNIVDVLELSLIHI